MKIQIVSFTKKGSRLCKELTDKLISNGHICNGFTIKEYSDETGLTELESSIHVWTKEKFYITDALIYIGACGIAVRAIAPYLIHKSKDPAVVVLDERGQYAISLLSGHIGGANQLTEQIGSLIGALPIITTATDLHGLFSVDTYAAKHNLFFSDYNLAKKISSQILNDREIAFYSDYPISSQIPKGLRYRSEAFMSAEGEPKGELNIYVTNKNLADKNTLILCPKILTLGIGCRRGVIREDIKEFITRIFEEYQLSMEAVERIASIDLKKNEDGIVKFAKECGVMFDTFSSKELNQLDGEFCSSEFVRSITGVDNVCERAAVLGSNHGKLIIHKKSSKGITLAVAMREWEVNFE